MIKSFARNVLRILLYLKMKKIVCLLQKFQIVNIILLTLLVVSAKISIIYLITNVFYLNLAKLFRLKISTAKEIILSLINSICVLKICIKLIV